MASTNTALPSYTKKMYGKRVLVFGGSSGMGFAVACAAYENGARVVISSSSQAKVDRSIERIRTGYPSPPSSSAVEGLTCNLADKAQIESNLETAFEGAVKLAGGPFDHVVYTAGDALNIKPVSQTSVEHIESSGFVRFTVPFLIAKLVLVHQNQYLLSAADSSFTVTSGSASIRPFSQPGWSILTGYGAGIEGSVRGLAKELAPIRVNCISPGSVKTELFGDHIDEATEEMFRKETLTGRIGRPEDIAESYLACMRDGFLTGDTIYSAGGRWLA